MSPADGVSGGKDGPVGARQGPGREALLAGVAAAIRRGLHGLHAEAACIFLDHYAAGIATADLAARPAEEVAAAAL
ncbi:MAG: hypothetical protein B7Z59_13990, partial [Acidiphilium sp. 37-67-22]